MADLYLNIQKIMKCSKSGQKVNVLMKNGETQTGIITDFSGTTFLIDGIKILISDIEDIEENNGFSIENYNMKLVKVITLDYEEIEGVIVSTSEDTIQCITENGPETIKIDSIYCIKSGENEVIVNDKRTRNYYEKLLKRSKTGSDEFKKALDAMTQYVYEEGYKESILLWKQYGSYLKENPSYCKKLIDIILKEKHIVLNLFEQALINGNKKIVEDLVKDDRKMSELEYFDDDIERIRKTIKTTNWDTGWYRTATRLFSMQKNKNGLAEVFYEASLLTVNKKSDEYSKTINAIASIKISEDKEGFIEFFNVYRDKLKTNAGFCTIYANALRTVQNWKKLEKDLPMLREQLKNSPEFIQKIEEEVEYNQSLPPFSMNDFPVLSKRMDEEDKLYDQEKELIIHLPDKNAIKSLLDIYLSYSNEEAYFELAKYALAFMSEDRDAMNKLFKMLNATEKRESFVYLIQKIPVFWCSDTLIKKYEEIKTESSKWDTWKNEGEFDEHLNSIQRYNEPNVFETAIINRDSEIIKKFIDNPSLLEEIGYSDNEIEDILSVDFEQMLSEENYTMRRILAFQGNKNHLAERFLFEAFYSNKLDMCNRLFPLLLEEGRGALILSLFEFDRTLKSKMSSLKRFYCLALCISEKDDNIFWEHMQNTWMEYPEEIILSRMLSIAKAKQNGQMIKKIEAQKKRSRLNPFEIALVDVDIDTIRKYVKNANLLVELGYTPDEIQKINKVFSVGGGETNTGMKPSQIATRVFLYQKNKNNLAERLFLDAINEDSPEYKMVDCRSLYQIYVGQHNYEMICSFYEKYIHLEMEQKFNRSFASYYCTALFELKRYNDFFEYYKKYREKWIGFNLYANLIFSCEVLDIHEYDDELWSDEIMSKCNPNTMAMYIKYVLKKDVTRIYSEKFLNLINLFFADISIDEISEITALLSGVASEKIILPQGALVVALMSEKERDKNIEMWFDYFRDKFDDSTKIDVVIKIESIFNDESGYLIDEAISVYRSMIKSDLNVSKLEMLADMISCHIKNQDDIYIWGGLQAELLKSGKGGIYSLNKYLATTRIGVVAEDFWSVYLGFLSASGSGINSDALFDIVMDYYGIIRESESIKKKKNVINELIRLSNSSKLDYTRCKNLAKICLDCGMEFESKIYYNASEHFVSQNTDGEKINNDKYDNKLNYLDYLLENLDTYDFVNNKWIFGIWSKYIILSDEDNAVINSLRNTIDNSQKWLNSDINILAKAILSDSTNRILWKLMKKWVEGKTDINVNVLGNIYYFISLQENAERESALAFAIDNNLKELAIELILTMLHIQNVTSVVFAQKKLKSVIKKGWFSDDFQKEKTIELFDRINESMNLSGAEDYIWNGVSVAMDLAMATEQYIIFAQKFREYLTQSCVKQCCSLISDMLLKDNTEGIETILGYIKDVLTEIPYKNIVFDMYNTKMKRNLNDTEKMALECIKKNYGNALGVNDLLSFYCDMTLADMKRSGLDTIQLLIKYTKNDSLLYETAACFLRDEKGVEENVQYYKYMLDYMELAQTEESVEYVVGAMVCGENYLKLCEKEVKSVKKLIEEQYTGFVDAVRKYQEFCDAVVSDFQATPHEEFIKVLFRAIMSGDWVSVLKYNPTDITINEVLKKHLKDEKTDVAGTYYRSVLKGIALYLLDLGDEKVEYTYRARMLWNRVFNPHYGFDFFWNVLRHVDEDCRLELKRLFALDIETLKIFREFFGRSIISQKNCCKYNEIFNVFLNPRNGDFFANNEVQEYLNGLKRESAISICESFEKLYVYRDLKTKNRSLVESGYEKNVFSNFLEKNTGDYYNIEKRYKRYKDKYILFMSVVKDIEDKSVFKRKKISTPFYDLRSVLYYFSVLADRVDEEIFKEEKEYADILNAITIALSDDSYIRNLNDFIAKKYEDLSMTVGVLLLLEQNKTDEAANIVLKDFSDEKQVYFCWKILANYGMDGQENELYQKCSNIAKQSGIQNDTFWVKNHKHSKVVDNNDPYSLIYKNGSFDNKKESFPNVAGNKNNREIQDDKITVNTRSVKYVQELSTRVPDYIRNFILKDYEDDELVKYMNLWKKERETYEIGRGNLNKLYEISINIGISLINKQYKLNKEFDENIMRETFGLIQENAIHDYKMIGKLHDILQMYIEKYKDLDSLMISINENRNELLHLCYEQDVKQQTRSSQDIEAASALVEVLTNISIDLSSAMSEDIIKERLKEYKKELNGRIKKLQRFRGNAIKLGEMIQEKINKLNYVPILNISHLYYCDNDKNNWSEKWLSGAEKSYVRGVVYNEGGAPANNVILNVTINGESRGEYTIDRIDPGRRIPFKVQYNKNDVHDSKVLWGAYLEYYDKITNSPRSYSADGEISVLLSDEEWKKSYAGNWEFDTTQKPKDEDFCGRTNELFKLDSFFSINYPPKGYPSLLITGLRRVGKSSLISFFINRLVERDNLVPVYVDGQNAGGIIENCFFGCVFEDLDERYKDKLVGYEEFKKHWMKVAESPKWVGYLSLYFKELYELLGRRKVIFFLDEMERIFFANRFENNQQAEDFYGMIRSIIQNYQEYVSFVFCGADALLTSCLDQKSESQMFQALQRIYVGRMNRNDIRDVFSKYNKKYDIEFSDDAIDEIMYFTNGLIWYTKIIARNIINDIICKEHILRDKIDVEDVDEIVEKLIKHTSRYGTQNSLLDINFGSKRRAIIQAMAKAINRPHESTNLNAIISMIEKNTKSDKETGELICSMSNEELEYNLQILEKMDFVIKDANREDSYAFSTELYRLLVLKNMRKIDKFIKKVGGEVDER